MIPMCNTCATWFFCKVLKNPPAAPRVFKDFVLTKDAEALCLEDALQRREVDDEELSHDGGQDGVAESLVTAQTHLVDHTSLRSSEGQSGTDQTLTG